MDWKEDNLKYGFLFFCDFDINDIFLFYDLF